MDKKNNRLIAATVAALMASAATAQESTELEAVVVTASRVKLDGFTAPTPTTVLGEEQIKLTAPTQVADVLGLVPSFRTTGQPASATVYADLRGIGAQRTLILVNGRRHVPTFSDGTVDLGVIPAILIERTEVVTGGASASWGSDAVSGVINLILKNDLQGVQGTFQGGISDRGDDENFLGSLAAGTAFADGRGHVLVAGEYSRSAGIRGLQPPNRSRPWSGRGTVGNASFATNGLPGTLYSEDSRRADVYDGGLITNGPLRGTTFLPNGGTGTFGYGQVFGNSMIGGTDNAGDAATPGGDLKFPFERWTGMGRLAFDVTDSTTVFELGS
jgi:iron complex outermembrane recepter protein